MKHIINFFKLIRWENILIMLLCMSLIEYSLILPYFKDAGISLKLSFVDFRYLLLSVFLVMAAGNIINDFHDQKADAINKPEKRIVGLLIPEKLALALGLVFNIAALVIIFFISRKFNEYSLMLIHGTAIFGLWYYNPRFKGKALIGNLIIAILCGLIILLPLVFEIKLHSVDKNLNEVAKSGLVSIVFAFAFFAFITTLVREIVKDMCDKEGDKEMNYQTLAVTRSEKGVKAWIITFLFFCLAGILYFQYYLLNKELQSIAYLFSILDIANIYLIIKAFRCKEKKDFHRLSLYLKVFMLLGILGILLF